MDDYQNEDGSYKYKAERRPAFFKKLILVTFIWFNIVAMLCLSAILQNYVDLIFLLFNSRLKSSPYLMLYCLIPADYK